MRCRRGAVAVETALAVAILMVPLLLGGFEFGRMLATENRLQDGVRSAATFAIGPAGAALGAAAQADCDAGDADCQAYDSLRRTVDGMIDASVGTDATVSMSIECFCFVGDAPYPAPDCSCAQSPAIRYLTIAAETGYEPLFFFFLGDDVHRLGETVSLRLGAGVVPP